MTFFRACFYITIAALGFAYLSNARTLPSQALTPEAKASLQRGDYFISVWRDKSRADKALDVFGVIDIAATQETIWAIMTDCSRTLEVVTKMTLCEVLETAPDDSWDIRRQKIKVGFLLPKSTSVFRSDYNRPHHIKISLLGGNMKVQEGVWILTALENGKTRVSYQARLRPKFPVPNNLLKRGVREDVPQILINLRTQSEQDQIEVAEPSNKP